MAILRNTAGQGVYVRAIDADGEAITTGVTCQISKDGGSESAAATGATHVAGGVWWQLLSQAETDAGTFCVRPTGTGVIPDPVIVVTDEEILKVPRAGAGNFLHTRTGGDAQQDEDQVQITIPT
jgi:hypothetical protein